MVLSNSIIFNELIFPVCWDKEKKYEDIKSNITGNIAVWETDEPNATLKFMTFASLSKSHCKTRLCNGDAGNGFVVKRDNQYYLEGVVTNSLKPYNQECRGNFFTTITSISYHVDEISDLEMKYKPGWY